MCVPGDGCSAEWAFGLALLSGLGDESLPPASVGLAGCAVGVCHRVSDPRLALYGSCLPLQRPWNRWGYEYSTLALLVDSGGCFVSLRGCSVCAGVVVFSTTPLACEKYHIAPQLCQKEKDTKEKWWWMGVRISMLSAWRLAV